MRPFCFLFLFFWSVFLTPFASKLLQRTNMVIYMCTSSFFFYSIIFGCLTVILVPKNDPKSYFGHVINRFSDMSGLISFKLGMLIKHVGLLMHIIFFRDWIQMADWCHFFFFVLLECFFNTICFKVDAQKKHDSTILSFLVVLGPF